MLEILLHGVSTRHYQAVLPAMAETAGVSKSNVSRETIEASEAALEELLGRHFEGQEILIIYLDASTSASNASWARWGWIVPGANRCWACARARPRTRRRFARINAVLQMKVRDYFVQGRRGWVRLHEKGGKEHEVPCHHNLEQYLDEYIAAAGIAGDPDAPLFQTAAGKTGTLTGKAMWQQDAYRMIQRRAAPPGIKTQDREPHLPGDRHHRVPEEQGHAGSRAAHRQPRDRPGRRSSTTAGRMRFHSTKSSGLRFDAPAVSIPRQSRGL